MQSLKTQRSYFVDFIKRLYVKDFWYLLKQDKYLLTGLEKSIQQVTMNSIRRI